MVTLRRLYLYAMSAVTLGLVAAGLRMLLAVVFDSLGLDGDPALATGGNLEQVSLAAALIGVALPVWAIHWWLIARARRGVGPDAARAGEDEHGSVVRAAYLAIVLAISLLVVTSTVQQLVTHAVQELLDLHPSFDMGLDIAGGLASFLVAGTVWVTHWRLRRADVRVGPLMGGAVLWPRLYVHGVQLVTLAASTGAFAVMITALADRWAGISTYGGTDDYVASIVPNNMAISIVLGTTFLAHAAWSQRLIAAAGWEGDDERASRVRIGYHAVVVLVGLAVVLTGLGEAGRALLLTALGQSPGGRFASTMGEPVVELARYTIVPLTTMVPWLLATLYARRRLAVEAGLSGDATRPAAARRLDQHLVALVGLVFGSIAVAWLLGVGLDALFGGSRYAYDPTNRTWDVASFLPNAVLGLAIWLAAWWRATLHRTQESAREAASGIRRAYLLVALGLAIPTGVVAGAFILYRAFSTLLGVAGGPGVISEVCTASGALIVAAAVAGWHGLLLREDARTTASGAAATQVTALPAPTSPLVERRFTLQAASADELRAAVDAIVAALPPGSTITDA